jgi:hypothetical protein
MLLAALAAIFMVASGDDTAAIALALIPLPVLGAVILSRHPGNRIGLLMLVTGSIAIASGTLQAYAPFAVTRDGWPGAQWTAWLSIWPFWPALYAYLLLLPLLFPTGQPVSPRWRIVVGLTMLLVAMQLAIDLVQPGGYEELSGFPELQNPVGIAGVERIERPYLTVLDVLLLTTVVLSVASIVVRFRRSSGIERQQLKWFVFVAVTDILLIVAMVLSPGGSAAQAVFGVAMILGTLVGLPVAIAIAVLRYRLYDIDRLISRTVVYFLLTASLLGVYLVLVLGLGSRMRSGDGESSQLVVAASTLAVAALFRPLRSRIQAVVDRRFYRKKYDAARTMEAFGSRLRDEIDLDTLGAELRAVVQETMQPAHVSLWLRSPQWPAP